MNHSLGEAADPVGAAAARPAAGRSTLGAILTDVHFWIPVAVLAVGLSLLGFLS
jgi:hypothetical protein